MKLKLVFKENLVKNAILLASLTILRLPIQNYIESSGLETHKDLAGYVLAAVSIISVLAGFGSFGFKYVKMDLKNPYQTYFAHILTGTLLFVIGISLIMTWKLISLILGPFMLMDITLLLLYLACAGYDYWDLVAACKES